jgi:hypothetical protein
MRIAATLWIAAFCLAEDGKGLRPRPAPEDYAVKATEKDLTIAASLLSSEQVKNAFATGLAPHYIVVEVAVYPAGGGAREIRADDFLLRIGVNRAVLRPVDARTIAARLSRKANADGRRGSPSDIALYPSVGVGVGSGGLGRRVGTGVGVGVGVGNGGPGPQPPPAPTDDDRKTMEIELSEKGLAPVKTTQPVAGYLYFPIPAKRKQTAIYELEYLGVKPKLTLELPAR